MYELEDKDYNGNPYGSTAPTQDPPQDYNPYAAPMATVADSYGYDPYASDTVLLATRGSRLAAVLIDGLISMAIMIPFIIVVFLNSTNDTMMMAMLAIMTLAVLIFGIYNLYLLHKQGQTVGKQIMKIKIVRSDLYTPVSLLRIIFLRYVPMSFIGQIPFVGAIVTLANYLWIFGAEQRCLHDMIADTHVIQVHSENQFANQAVAAHQSYQSSSDW